MSFLNWESVCVKEFFTFSIVLVYFVAIEVQIFLVKQNIAYVLMTITHSNI